MEIRTYPFKIDLDLDEVSELYYDEELTMREIAKRLGASQQVVRKFIEDHDLEKRTTQSVKEIQDELFGEYCISCRKPREVIHRKDGVPHKRSVTWSKTSLRTLNPDEWASLCKPCHRLTHSLMKSFGCEWDDIEKILKKLADDWLS